jgi:DNA-directed RNA polymerase subunit RPC12/RpoP
MQDAAHNLHGLIG